MRKHGKKRGRMPSTKIGRLALIGIIVAVFALGATAAVSLRTSKAAKAKGSQPGQSKRTPANLNFRAGVREIPLDPQTGQVRPLTQEEAQRMAEGIKQLANQSTDGLQAVRHADGSVSVNLQGHFQNIAVVKRNDDGSLTESCVDNPKAAAVFFEIDPQLVGAQPDAASPKSDSPAPVKGRDQ